MDLTLFWTGLVGFCAALPIGLTIGTIIKREAPKHVYETHLDSLLEEG